MVCEVPEMFGFSFFFLIYPPLLPPAPTARRLGGLMGLGISVPNSSPSMRNRLCYASLHSPSPLSPHFLCPAFFTIIHPCWNCKLQTVENTFSTLVKEKVLKASIFILQGLLVLPVTKKLVDWPRVNTGSRINGLSA